MADLERIKSKILLLLQHMKLFHPDVLRINSMQLSIKKLLLCILYCLGTNFLHDQNITQVGLRLGFNQRRIATHRIGMSKKLNMQLDPVNL